MGRSRWLGSLVAWWVVACSANEPDENTGDPPQEQKVVGTGTGAEVYAEHCAQCHGDAGKGDSGPMLAGRALIPFNVIGIVTKGQGTMTGFADVLTKDEIDSVAFFVEKL